MRRIVRIAVIFWMSGWLVGCEDESATLRRIQSQRQITLQQQTEVDHLGETVSLLEQFMKLNQEKASRQITYHLNQWWRQRLPEADAAGENPTNENPTDDLTLPPITRTLSDYLNEDTLRAVVLSDEFLTNDVSLLRDAYLFNRLVSWVDSPLRDDPLLADWLESLRRSAKGEEEGNGKDDDAKAGDAKDGDAPAIPSGLSIRDVDRLQTATRLFDWTVRNIALEPEQVALPPQLPQFPLPAGMKMEGPGYRQTDFQTLWRGRGDWLQRGGVFMQLCQQAGIPTAMLATQSDETGQRTPWSVGVLIGDQIFLFQPQLGLPVPGPDQFGIATLEEARKDASVMRRLDVAGYFDFPLARTDVQQNIALLNIRAETTSPRMKAVEDGLTGDRRMTLHVDADELAERFDDVPGIAGARIWEVPTVAEGYQAAMRILSERDPVFSFWYTSRNAVLESGDSNNLAEGRWRHLTGQFADDEIEGIKGARTHYLEQRAPEFEIDDLRINVELQKQYGIRRSLGMDPAEYDQQLTQVQGFMRLGKRTATFWLSLVQYDDARFETAHNWLTKRVLDEEQRSHWEDSAIYNAARASEATGDFEAAIETLKTDGPVYGHGNRLRARLLGKMNDTPET